MTAAAAFANDVTLLVNNAGVAFAQDLVVGDLGKIRQEIETNVFGTLSMIGMVDTDTTATLDVEKTDPADFVKIVLDGIENGQVEIVTDGLSRRAKAALADQPGLFAP